MIPVRRWACLGAAPARLPLAASAPTGLQEVAPPPAVQQLQEALAGREPRVEILTPADDTVLPPGPWTLRLRVHDWPLVDAGPLGLGPHLVVQLDDEPPLRLTSTEISLPALTPGSHRLTVFAARPWGEAAKNPGAWRQIRLHRSAANPLALPQPGRAQLIAVSPPAGAAAEPLLLDWLLLDAPLQNLRSDDGRWRLRVTINGDGFVIDRQTPLWLRGWKPGRNAIRLELLDGRGEPLNPPYNSLVREVDLGPSQPAARWQKGPLSAGELAILLGEAPAEVDQRPSGTETEPPISGEEGSAQSGGLDPASLATPVADVRAAAAASATSGEATETRKSPTEAAADAAAGATGSAPATAPDQAQASAEPTGASSGRPAQTPAAAPLSPASADVESSDLTERRGAPQSWEDGTSPSVIPPSTAAPSEPTQPDDLSLPRFSRSEPGPRPEPSARPGLAELPPSSPTSPRPEAAPSIPPADLKQAATPTAAIPADSLRLRPSSSIGGSAREQVNADGTMVRPPRRGPLAGLRERLLP